MASRQQDIPDSADTDERSSPVRDLDELASALRAAWSADTSTADQFDFAYELGEPVEREPIVDHTGIDRHQLLAQRVDEHLRSNGQDHDETRSPTDSA